MSNPVPLPDSLRKRFYEPIVLFDALKYVYRKNKKISEPDLESETGKSKQQTYFCFLNKLSQICDNQPQQPLGKTVSAIVVLDSGTIEYRFASNQRDGEELDAVKQYLTGILSILGRVRDDEVSSPKSRRLILSRILHKVLAFNRPRVEAYIESLLFEDRLEFCITSASGDGTTDGRRSHSQSCKIFHVAQFSNADILQGSLLLRHWDDSNHSSMRQEAQLSATKMSVRISQQTGNPPESANSSH